MSFGNSPLLIDGVSFIAASTGTGDFVFSLARPSFYTPAQAVTAGTLTDGQAVSYLAQDDPYAPTQREWGHGTYSNSSLTVQRTTVIGGISGGVSSGTSKVNFTKQPVVSLTALAEDLVQYQPTGFTNVTLSPSAGTAANQLGDWFEIQTNTTGTQSLGMVAYSSAGGNVIQAVKTAGSAPGTQSLVGANTELLRIRAQGSDGTAFQDAARFIISTDGTPAASSMPGRFAFFTTPSSSTTATERLRIDSAGRSIFQASTTATTAIDSGVVQIVGQSSNAATLSFSEFSSTQNPQINFNLSVANTYGTFTAINSSGFFLGGIQFNGSNGTTFVNSGGIFGVSDGAFSGSANPLRMQFYTGSGSSATGPEAMRINSKQEVNIGNQADQLAGVFGTNPTFQISAAAGIPGDPAINIRNYNSTTSAAAFLEFTKSHNSTLGTNTTLVSGETIGYITASGYDATGTPVLREASAIAFTSDATPTVGHVPGRLMFFTSSATTADVEALRINANGSVMQALAALATTATDGFFYINSCAGAPTGAPTAAPGGAVAMVFDTTNSKIWVRTGGAWKGVVVA